MANLAAVPVYRFVSTVVPPPSGLGRIHVRVCSQSRPSANRAAFRSASKGESSWTVGKRSLHEGVELLGASGSSRGGSGSIGICQPASAGTAGIFQCAAPAARRSAWYDPASLDDASRSRTRHHHSLSRANKNRPAHRDGPFRSPPGFHARRTLTTRRAPTPPAPPRPSLRRPAATGRIPPR